nr:DUF4115 domain-containing protein [Roseomonas sp. SXEYE001]
MMTADAARVGKELRDARLALGATLEEVADSLRINRRYLAALEEGRSDELPGSTYALGFVRTYARALGLDADDLARRYRENGVVKRGQTDLVFPEPVPERGIPAGVVILIGMIVMVGAYAVWWNWSGSADRAVDQVPPPPARVEEAAREARQAVPPIDLAPVLPSTPAQTNPGAGAGRPGVTPPSPGVQAGTPAPPPGSAESPAAALPGSAPPAAPTTPTAPAEPPSRIILRATEDSWVQIRDPRAGQTVLNRVLRSGESFAVPRDGLVMSTGKAQGLELVVDGQPSPVLVGRVGVVRDIALNPDQLRQPRPAAGTGR